MPRRKEVEEKPHQKQVDIIRIHQNPPGNEADRELAKVQLLSLKEHPGWKRVQKYYIEKMEVLESLLWKEGKKKTKEEVDSIIDRRNMCTQFMNIPDILIGGIDLNITSKSPNLDPFDKPKSYEEVVKETLT